MTFGVLISAVAAARPAAERGRAARPVPAPALDRGGARFGSRLSWLLAMTASGE